MRRPGPSGSARLKALALGLGALAVLGFVGASYARDMDLARARLQGRSQLVATSFGAVEFAQMGVGPTVLAIHGSGGGFDQGLEMAAPLAARGHRLIAPSRFGYLRSDAPAQPTPALQADALDDLLDRMGEDQVVILGVSAGALSALQLAIRHPARCRALVLLVPAAHAPTRRPTADPARGPVAKRLLHAALGSDLLFWVGLQAAPDALIRSVLATDPDLVHEASSAERRRVEAIGRHILPVSARRRGLEIDFAVGNEPAYALDAIACPVLAISAKDDLYETYAAAQHTARHVRNGRFLGFDTGGHVLVGRQDEVWRAVDAFIAATAPDAMPRPSGPSPEGSRPNSAT